MALPYLDSDHLEPRMVDRPDRPFLVRPFHYTVVDGDTLRLRTAPDQAGERHEAFRIRLLSINTPELRKRSLFDQVLAASGYDPVRSGPGEVARDFVRKHCAGRVLLIEPQIDASGNGATDPYGRLLARVCVSGSRGKFFDLDGAFSLSRRLLDAGLAQVMRGQEIPAAHPAILEGLRARQGYRPAQDEDLPTVWP